MDPERPERALRGLPIVITHIKPSTEEGPTARPQIEEQLHRKKALGVRYVFPRQGVPIRLYTTPARH